MSVGAFSGLTSLRRLSLGNSLLVGMYGQSGGPTSGFPYNAFTSLPKGVFANLSSLEDLSIEWGELSSLPAGVFDGLTNLRTLDLSHNVLTSLPRGLFAGLTSLEDLAVARTEITSLPGEVFSDLTNLKNLDLGANLWSSVSADAFSGLAEFEVLSLTNDVTLTNTLPTLPPNLFAGLESLESLHVWGSSMPPGLFSGLESLEYLWIISRVSTVPPDLFSGLNNLETLGLKGGSLRWLPVGLFDDLSNLRSLYLHRNSLSSLRDNLLSNLVNLELLWLSHNSLSSLPFGLFKGFTNLENLQLGYNASASLPLVLELEYVDIEVPPGEGKVQLRLSPGAPFDIGIDLEVAGGASSVDRVTILKGETHSAIFTVTQVGNQAASVSLGTPPALPATTCGAGTTEYSCFAGFALETGPPLALFEELKLELTRDSISENAGATSVTAKMSEPAPVAFTVDVSASARWPAVDGDFTLSSNTTLNFAANATESTGTVTITANDNSVPFPGSGVPGEQEKVVLVRGDLSTADVATPAAVRLEIADDEVPMVTVSLAAERFQVTEGSTVLLTASLSTDPKREVVVPLVASPRGGAAAEDYWVPDVIAFGSGQTEVRFPFTAIKDSDADSGEEVSVFFAEDLPTKVTAGAPITLRIGGGSGSGSGGGGGGVGGGGGGGSPPDDDDDDDDDDPQPPPPPPAPPTVSVAGAEALESAGAVVFDVRLSASSGSAVTVDYATADGAGVSGAEAGLDYTAVQGTLTFPAGSTAQQIRVPVTDDAGDEGEAETFTLTLRSPRNASLAGGDSSLRVTGTILDDDSGPPGAAFAVEGATCSADLCRVVTGEAVRFADTSAGTVRSRRWEFGDGKTSRGRRPQYAWSEPGFYEVTLWVSDGVTESTASRTFLVEASVRAGFCVADRETLCLQDSRYSVVVEWRKADGESGAGSVVHAGTNDSGLFTFFNSENWEILIKVLDGCALNGHVWVYGASTTDLGYTIRVTDTVADVAKEYTNEPGQPAGAITDGVAFPEGCRQ